MTTESRNPLSRLSSRAMAIYLSLALIAIHIILLLGGFLRQNAAENVGQQLEALQSNVEQLNSSELQELERLQTSKAEWESKIAELEGQLPEPSQPYPVYEQAKSISEAEGAAVLQAQRSTSEMTDTQAGRIMTEVHGATLESSLAQCLNVVAELEADGGVGLAMQSITVSPDEETCSLIIATVARSAQP